jgi:hypothetical protein
MAILLKAPFEKGSFWGDLKISHRKEFLANAINQPMAVGEVPGPLPWLSSGH